jgi:DNA-binding transcriptional regulator LsrR (DeoR family)
MANSHLITDDLLARVADYVFSSDPVQPKEIVRNLQKHGMDVEKGRIFTGVVPELIRRGWVRLLVEGTDDKEIGRTFDLQRVRVTQTTLIDDVAAHAADIVRDLILEKAEVKDTIHLGFSGGSTMRAVFRKLTHALSKPDHLLPSNKTLVCHALVAGFANHAAGTHPTAFFSYLDDAQTPFSKEFVLFLAPAFVPNNQLRRVRTLPAFVRAKSAAEELDVIVTSAAAFEDDHSQLSQYYLAQGDERERLAAEKCIGDMLWLPIDCCGRPLDLSSYDHRPSTLLQLDELPNLIQKRDTKVVLVIGRCADCNKSKGSVLKAILDVSKPANERLVTHLVVDIDTSRELAAAGGGSTSENSLARAAHELFANPGSKIDEELKKKLQEEHNINIGGNRAFKMVVPSLMEKGWVEVLTPKTNPLIREVGFSNYHLDELRVTRTSNLDDVASQAAYMIRDLLTLGTEKKDVFRIGFSGGNVTRRVFQKLTEFLRDANYKLPYDKKKTLACHALVVGFDDGAPGTDPSSFFTYLHDSHHLYDRDPSFTTEFHLLHAPAFVRKGDLVKFMEFPAIERAHHKAQNIDLIVTSAASFEDEHSQLKKYLDSEDKDRRRMYNALRREGCLGDMLWLPINAQGPIDLSEYQYRPVTLLPTLADRDPVELNGLCSRIGEGKRVLLVVGRCADPENPCDVSKAPLLEAILNLQRSDRRYITHLVLDSSTARDFIDRRRSDSNLAARGSV